MATNIKQEIQVNYYNKIKIIQKKKERDTSENNVNSGCKNTTPL